MKRIYKNIFLLFIFFTINIFSSKDAIIAPKKYKPAEMNLEITKVKLKEIEGTINEVKKELYISKKDLTVDTDDILFITEEKNKLRENFNFQKKNILNNENYVFSYKQHKDNIYLVHCDKNIIKKLYKINIKKINYDPSQNFCYFNILNTSTLEYIEINTAISTSDGIAPNGISSEIRGLDFLDFYLKDSSLNNIPTEYTTTFKNNSVTIKNNATLIFEGTLTKTTNLTDRMRLDGQVINPFYKNISLALFKNLNNTETHVGWLIINKGGAIENPLDIQIINDMDFGEMTNSEIKSTPIVPGKIQIIDKNSVGYTITLGTNSLDLTDDSKTSKVKIQNINIDEEIQNNKGTLKNHIITGEAITTPNTTKSNGIHSGTLNINIVTKQSQGGKF